MTARRRPLGTMMTHGYPRLALHSELDLAQRLGAEVLEVLPAWRELPSPLELRQAVAERGLRLHSAHGCWGGQSIRASRVDLGDPDPRVARESIDDLKRCVDWLHAAGGAYLVVHPGGLSHACDRAARRGALAASLTALADHASGGGVIVCVENMPPGVHPGSRMEDLSELLRELARDSLALALDTGHAHLSAGVVVETMAAADLMATTHVHDNNGRIDSHDPPGRGTIDWDAWARALDRVDYAGPIMLECIRQIRSDPSLFLLGPLEPLLEGAGRGAPGDLGL